MTNYILAHDLGTSGDKATLYRDDGQLIASATYNYGVKYIGKNGVEQDPEIWWQAVCITTHDLISNGNVNISNIACVSFSGQMMGCVCVDKQGQAIRNSLIWADQRSTQQVAEIRSEIDDLIFYHKTGHRNSASYGGQKLMWIKQNEPENYRKIYKFMNAKDFIILKLTGKYVTDYTDASSTNLFNLDKLRWDNDLVKAMGINESVLPDLYQSTDVAGTVNHEASESTGLLEGTPVVCGGGDGVCAAVGSGCISKGTAHTSLGTSSWLSVTSETPLYDPKMRTFNWAHIVPGYVLPTGTMQSGGGSFAWFVNQILYHGLNSDENVDSDMLYQKIEDKIRLVSPGSNGLVFLPYLLGERSPRWNVNARGAFIGLTSNSTDYEMLNAIQEGVCMNLNAIFSCFEKLNIEDIVAIGGGARSRNWCVMLANILDCKIKIPMDINLVTSKGAAITGAVGIGLIPNFEASRDFNKANYEFMPNKDIHDFYTKEQKVFDPNCQIKCNTRYVNQELV